MQTLHKPFSIVSILKHAWRSSFDSKAAIWAPALASLILSLIIALIAAMLQRTFFNGDTSRMHPLGMFIMQLVSAFVIAIAVAPFVTGMLMTAIKRARGESIEGMPGFQYVGSWPKLAVINIIITAFAMLIDLFFTLIMALIIRAGSRYVQNGTHIYYANGILMLIAIIIFLCYLTFYAFVVFAMPMSVDKQKSPWDAICSAARVVLPHWIKMVCIEIIIAIIMILTLLPFFLSSAAKTPWVMIVCAIISLLILIWTLPYIMLVHGEAYKRLVD